MAFLPPESRLDASALALGWHLSYLRQAEKPNDPKGNCIGEYCSLGTEIQQYSLEMDRDPCLASVISKIAGI